MVRSVSVGGDVDEGSPSNEGEGEVDEMCLGVGDGFVRG